MREHPVPQDITGYNFHIIGELTLKQFLEVGAGFVIGFLIYSTNLPAVLKWPFIILMVGLGAMAAFVPIEEQPFDHWIIVFFKTLYKPTKFYWRKKTFVPDLFLFVARDPNAQIRPEVDMTPARKERIKEFITSLEPQLYTDEYDLLQQQRALSIMTQFTTDAVDTPYTSSIQEVSQLESAAEPITETVFTNSFAEIVDASPVPTPAKPDSITIPQEKTIVVEQSATFSPLPTTPTPAEPLDALQTAPENTNSVSTAGQDQATVVNYNTALPFPTAPAEPNKIVGMVLTTKNELLNNAIVEIQNTQGIVVRAVRTNSLGQFYITTPLENGEYVILIEKEGYQFSPQKLILDGSLVPPLDLRSLA